MPGTDIAREVIWIVRIGNGISKSLKGDEMLRRIHLSKSLMHAAGRQIDTKTTHSARIHHYFDSIVNLLSQFRSFNSIGMKMVAQCSISQTNSLTQRASTFQESTTV